MAISSYMRTRLRVLIPLIPTLFRVGTSGSVAVDMPAGRTRSKSLVASGTRLDALDLARFVAMIGMVQGHVLDALVSPTWLNVGEFPWSIWHYIRGFTAPIFLIVSGVVHVFANKRDALGYVPEQTINKRIRWGITLIGIAILMVFPAKNIWHLPYATADSWTQVFAVNILQLTGMTMLVFVCVLAATRSVKSLGVVSAVIAVCVYLLTPIISSINWTDWLPLPLASYLSPNFNSTFPLFPWSAYFFLGVAIGAYLHHVPGKDRSNFIKSRGGLAGIALVLPCAFAGAYHTAPQIMFLERVGVVLIFFSICVIIVERSSDSLRRIFTMFSAKSLYIYVIHLILLFGLPWYDMVGRMRYRQLELTEGFIYVGLILTSTLLIAYLIDRIQALPWSGRQRKMFHLTALTVLTLLIVI